MKLLGLAVHFRARAGELYELVEER